jgi:hypothetical protein
VEIHSWSKANIMWMTIGIILLVLWALGAFVVPVGGALIHLLLLFALVAIVFHLVSGRKLA